VGCREIAGNDAVALQRESTPADAARHDLRVAQLEAAHDGREDEGPFVTRVLLVCPEPIVHGQPAGIGIRFLEIAKALQDDGHSVAMLSRDGGAFDATPQNIASW